MGHSRIGKLPVTRKWRQVIALISGGADVRAVAAATSAAAERSLARASGDKALTHAFWLLTQIPVAAREEDLPAALRRLGLEVSEAPTLPEICTATIAALDKVVRQAGRRSDFGEIAQLSLVESLNAIVGRETPSLFGSDLAHETRVALGALATMRQFSVLARDFYARLLRRSLEYFLSRELSNHVGINQRFQSVHQHREFETALEAHCRETARIVQDFAGEWFSKANYEGGIDLEKAGRFAHVAFQKLCAELQLRRDARA